MSAPAAARPKVADWRIGVIAVVLTAVIVGVVLWGTLGRPAPASSGECGLECGIGTPAIGTPQPEGGPNNHSYVMQFTPSSGLTWGQVTFAIEAASGQYAPPNPSWEVLIFNATSGPDQLAATYGFQTGTWSEGAQVLATSGQTIHLELGSTNLKGQGYSFVMIINSNSGSSQAGQVSASLP